MKNKKRVDRAAAAVHSSVSLLVTRAAGFGALIIVWSYRAKMRNATNVCGTCGKSKSTAPVLIGWEWFLFTTCLYSPEVLASPNAYARTTPLLHIPIAVLSVMKKIGIRLVGIG